MSTVDSSKSDETVRSEGGEVNKGLRSSITSEFQNLNLDDNEKRNEFKEIASRQHEFIKELKKDLEELTSEVERLSKEKYESELRGKSSKNSRDEVKVKGFEAKNRFKNSEYAWNEEEDNFRDVEYSNFKGRITLNSSQPTFSGLESESIVNWLYTTRINLSLARAPEELKVTTAASYLRGFAQTTFMIEEEHNPAMRWDEFCSFMKYKFLRSDHELKCHSKLSKLKQTGSVAEYVQSFQQLINQLVDLPERYKVNMFTDNLAYRIRVEVKSRKPATLNEAVNMALDFEDDKEALKNESDKTSEKIGESINFADSKPVLQL